VSDFDAVEQNHINAAGREGLHIGRRRLTLRTRQGGLQRCHIVETQFRHQMENRRAHGRRTGPRLTSYLRRPGIFFAIGTWVSK